MPEASGARDWTLFLRDMQHFCSKVMRYTSDLDQQQFLADEMILDWGYPNSVDRSQGLTNLSLRVLTNCCS